MKKDVYNETKTIENEEEHKRAQAEELVAQAEIKKSCGRKSKGKEKIRQND